MSVDELGANVTLSLFLLVLGGICERFRTISGKEQTLNTGIVTVLNYGEQVPSLITSLTFAHEAGHNFGSNVSNSLFFSVNGLRLICYVLPLSLIA